MWKKKLKNISIQLKEESRASTFTYFIACISNGLNCLTLLPWPIWIFGCGICEGFGSFFGEPLSMAEDVVARTGIRLTDAFCGVVGDAGGVVGDAGGVVGVWILCVCAI